MPHDGVVSLPAILGQEIIRDSIYGRLQLTAMQS